MRNFLFLSILLLFITGACENIHNRITDTSNLLGTSCTTHSDCGDYYCDFNNDTCKEKEIGGVIISFTTRIAEAAFACETGEAYMASGIKTPVCTCSQSKNIGCEDGTGSCLSNGMCSKRQGTNGGY